MSKVQTPAPAPAKGFDAAKFASAKVPVEVVHKFKEIFDVFDYDGSGNVSPQEIVNTVRALGLESQAGQIIATIHSSGHTGEIDFHAFLEIFALTSESNAEASLQLVFEEFDKKATGGFDATDFERVAASVGEHFSAAEVDQIIDYADKDRDGVISYEEFLHVVTKVYPKV